MVPALGFEANARTVVQPQPAPFGLFAEYFQPLTPPQPLNLLMIDLPTDLSQ